MSLTARKTSLTPSEREEIVKKVDKLMSSLEQLTEDGIEEEAIEFHHQLIKLLTKLDKPELDRLLSKSYKDRFPKAR